MRDIHFVVFQHTTGRTPAAWPAHWMGVAPREAHRQRRRETLLVVADFFGSARPDLRAQERLLQRGARAYFQTGGPVTAALKALTADLHRELQNANRRLRGRGRQVLARLAVWVWKGSQVYLALVGPWQVHVLAPQRQVFPPDPENWGAPLGLTAAEPWVDYQRLDGDTGPWLLAAEPLPPGLAWDALLGPDPKPALADALRRSPHPVRGVWLDAQPGSGQMQRDDVQAPWSRTEAAPPTMTPADTGPTPRADTPASTAEAKSAPKAQARAKAEAPASAEVAPSPRVAAPRRTRRGKPRRAAVSRRRRGAAWLRRLAAWVQAGYARLPRLPAGVWLFLAVVVPLAVTAASVAVYVRKGNAVRQARWLAVAQQHAAEAQAAADPLAQREAWAQALVAINEAARYGDDPAVTAQREQILRALDALDGTRRLAFRPLIVGHLGSDVRLTRVAVGVDDLYALDAAQNRIWRFRWTGSDAFRYEHDPRFRCRAQRYGTLDLGTLVDLAVLPPARYPFRVLTVDQGGVLLTCDPEAGAQARPLPQPPSGWEQVQRAHVWEQRLYLLDTGANAFYRLDLNRLETAAPQPLLDTATAAPDFQNVMDFALLGGEAYFLFVDTQVVRCRYFADQEPQPCVALTYQDERPGRSSGPVFAEARFTQILALSRPEPALYLLDPEQQAVYRFSLALRFVEQYRPAEPLPAVTGFAIGLGPDGADYLYLVGPQQVYAAPLH